MRHGQIEMIQDINGNKQKWRWSHLHYQMCKRVINAVVYNSYYYNAINTFNNAPGILFNSDGGVSANVFYKKINLYKNKLVITITPNPAIPVISYPNNYVGISYPELYLYYTYSINTRTGYSLGLSSYPDILNNDYTNLNFVGAANNPDVNLPSNILVNTKHTVTANNGRIIEINSTNPTADIYFPKENRTYCLLFNFCYEIDPLLVPSLPDVLNYPIEIKFEIM